MDPKQIPQINMQSISDMMKPLWIYHIENKL